MLVIGSAEHKRFEEHWAQYANGVYNLSIILTCSSKLGWVLARDTMLESRLNYKLGKGESPRTWFYKIIVELWLAPNRGQIFLPKFINRQEKRWESLLPRPVEAGLIYLSDENESLCLFLKKLKPFQRIALVLRLKEDL